MRIFPRRNNAEISFEEIRGLYRYLRSSRKKGEEIAAFEEEFAVYLGVKYAALFLALGLVLR